MDVRDNAASRNGCFDEGVKLLVSSDGELQVARSDALHLEILACVSCKLQHLGGEILEDGSGIYRSSSTDALNKM